MKSMITDAEPHVRPLRRRHHRPPPILPEDAPMSEEPREQRDYSIGEVSDIVGQEAHVLRYWEQEFDQLNPRKNRAGRRAYTVEDIAMVERIQHLLKEEKYTIAGARQVLDRRQEEARQEEAFREELKDLRSLLLHLRNRLPS
jgi:DNA-binding transcriptional MerR regulator